MSRNVPITWEQEIIAALKKDPYASRVPRALGDVIYATAWRIADRNAIALAAGRETAQIVTPTGSFETTTDVVIAEISDGIGGFFGMSHHLARLKQRRLR